MTQSIIKNFNKIFQNRKKNYKRQRIKLRLKDIQKSFRNKLRKLQFFVYSYKNNTNTNQFLLMMLAQKRQSLKQIFGDIEYAWELLESEVNFETSENISGEDVSHLLQLYMRGVQRMNSMVDIRESYFKNRVTSLMSRPTVIKILNKPMVKKNQAPIIETTTTPTSPKKIDNKTQLQLKQKRQELQMRLAYGAQQHNPDNLRKLITQQSQKQSFLTSKIDKIVDDHEQRLMKRVRERKLRTMTAKSRADIYNNQFNEGMNGNFSLMRQMMQKKRDQQQFGTQSPRKIRKMQLQKRKIKSMSPKRTKFSDLFQNSPSKRRVSMDLRSLLKSQKN